MKCVVFFCLVVLSLALANPLGVKAGTIIGPRGCRYILGTCVEECPVGTHSYGTACGDFMPEATCENPKPVLQEGMLCDYSSCYCDAPTVRDENTGQCVTLDKCPKVDKVIKKKYQLADKEKGYILYDGEAGF